MSRCLVFEDGNLIKDNNSYDLWHGKFSRVKKNGSVLNFIKNNLPKNTVFVIPACDGNIKKHYEENECKGIEWYELQIFIDYAKRKNKTFILGLLSQVDKEEEGVNYLYIPLDDDFFENGIEHYFPHNTLSPWTERSSELCWRGSCSGMNGGNSLRINFVKKLFDYPQAENVRLSNWWSENKNIDAKYFADRIDYTEFLKYKIYFIVDGNVIASNHMWGFASGCVPFLISNGTCWFSSLIKPYVHYIPINYDLSNLIEQIEYVKNNDTIAEQIAKNALQFSKEYFSSEYQKKYLLENINKFTCDQQTVSTNITTRSKKIIDCCTFYNELELLYYRLNLLYDVVDYFIIVESNYTHAGRCKELYYKNNFHLFKKFSDKIIHIVVDLPFIYPNIDYDKNEQWTNENFQRNSINNGIKQLTLDDDDLIIISDLDEIISPHKIAEFKNMNIIDGVTLLCDMYYYNLNYKHKEPWTLMKLVTYKKYKETTPQKVRTELNLPRIDKCGWHLSYFGDAKFINNKLREFGHQEYNSEYYTDISNIESKISNGEDLFGRNYVPIENIKIEDNNFLPPNYNLYLSNYYKETKQLETQKNEKNQKNQKIVVYFHICCINNWLEVVSNLLFKIKQSGLYNKIFEIRCIVLGNYANIEDNKNLFQDEKIKIIYNSDDISHYEKSTINILYEHSKLEDFYVLYIHSKGIKHYKTDLENNVYDWVEYLSYFNIFMHSKCIELLECNQAVGVNLQVNPQEYPLHYSGNFWWSKSSHIKNLHPINDNFYNSPEFWVTNGKGNYASLWNSNVHHYNSPYKFTNYENKDININIICNA
jgi:beta-1,4-mannosyl-glycoprotein beta-1,4-N-acetylglucosaminyltransferase